MALRTWLPDPEAQNQLNKAYKNLEGLGLDEDTRQTAHINWLFSPNLQKEQKEVKNSGRDKCLSLLRSQMKKREIL